MDDSPASLDNEYFEQKYAESSDPWGFETSDYERAKYADTIASLGRERYQDGLEIGCSIGVLTRLLAPRCARLLAIDVVDSALARARERCADLDHVSFARMRVPEEFPARDFDLILLSEVGYYLSKADLQRTAGLMCAHVRPSGQLLLVHYRPAHADPPQSGDEVHDMFFDQAQHLGLDHRHGHRTELYRVDLYERRE